MLAAIFGLAGPDLSAEERAFFADTDPAGFILFKRNCVDRAQLRALTDSLRDISGRDRLPILIDQEGGRVARLQPPEWPAFPPAGDFDRLYDIAPISAMEAVRANAAAIALTLVEVGINVDCLPLLDVRQPDAHDIIGDRALGSDGLRVAALGRAVIEGLRDAGVVAVAKHVPGHGRATSDSHLALPVVDADELALETDLMPFRSLVDHYAMAMTAHVVYPAWDAERCASLSPTVIEEIVRKRIGFDGFLMSDDLGMHALTGSFGDRARGVIAAGCDVALHCSGDMAEMREIADAVGPLSKKSGERLDNAFATLAEDRLPQDGEERVSTRDRLLALIR